MSEDLISETFDDETVEFDEGESSSPIASPIWSSIWSSTSSMMLTV